MSELICSYVFTTKINLTAEKDLDIKTRGFFSRLNCEQCIIIMSCHPHYPRAKLNNR
jgi:hypothetical protein